MPRANLAESILSFAVGPSRASELIGDLLESHPNYGHLQFWTTVFYLAVRLTWRTTVGIGAAMITGICCSWLPFVFMITRVTLSQSDFVKAAMNDTRSCLMISFLCWCATAFSLVRFSPLHRLSSISLIGALLATATLCTKWMHGAPTILWSLLIALLFSCISFPSLRRPFAALTTAVTLGSVLLWIDDKIPLNQSWYSWELSTSILLTNFFVVVSLECKTLVYVYGKLERFQRTQTQSTIEQ